MAQVTLIGKRKKEVLQFNYANHFFGARRTENGWWIFLECEYIGSTKDSFPFQYAYEYLAEHPELTRKEA